MFRADRRDFGRQSFRAQVYRWNLWRESTADQVPVSSPEDATDSARTRHCAGIHQERRLQVHSLARNALLSPCLHQAKRYLLGT